VATRLLCVGDIHLGRRPSGLTEAAAERVDVRDFTPAAAWLETVSEALRLQVDGVLLAGDVVEQRDDFYEAYGVLDEGVKRLVGRGIRVLGVAGNHDGLALPRLADAIPEFRLLGRGGRWEFDTIESADGPRVRVLGWSFPQTRVGTDPLAELPPVDDTGSPTVGLLHCDRDAGGSRYAPVRSSDLDRAPVDAWFLGHIHKPDALSGPRPIGYLGALTALDPSDEGRRGPWLVEIAGRGSVEIEQLALAPLRFERLDLDVSGLDEAEDLRQLVPQAIEQLHAKLTGSDLRPRAVGVRLHLRGRTPHRPALEAERRRLVEMVVQRDDTVYFVQKAVNETLPDRDLREIASGGRDPYALLAARVVALRAGADDPVRRRLIARARARLERVRNKPIYARLDPPSLDDESLSALLQSAALEAMDLLEQRREGEP
jgi:exonuclease SbcD